MAGVRLEIEPCDWTDFENLPAHYCGGPSMVDCPNCRQWMFTAMHINFSDVSLSKHKGLWEKQRLVVPFYMEPYWVKQNDDGRLDIIGGDRSDDEIINPIEQNFAVRKIVLRDLESSATAGTLSHEYNSRTIDPGVYHQIGGIPFKRDSKTITCCDCSGEMTFLGILDYDDLNVPLYENGLHPVALIIGDYDCMNLYSCISCHVLGLVWAR